MTSLRWTVLDTWTLTRRGMLHLAAQPVPALVGLLFPVLTLVMFGSLLGGQMEVPEGTSYFELLVPGMLVLTVVFGLEGTMLAVTTDAARGVTDRFRTLPMAPAAVVGARAAADLLFSTLGLAVMLASGLLVGWRWHEGLGDALLAVGLLLLLRLALVWVGVALGLLARTPEAVVAVQILVWPVAFLSSAFVSPASMPGVLGTIAAWSPLSATIEATRQLFGNPSWGDRSWPAEHATLLAVLWPLALLAVAAPLAVHLWRRQAR
jgi:ABC transporter DrrB family efflux protein